MIDFVKNVGRKLTGEDSTPQARSPQGTVVQAQKAAALAGLIRQLGLQVDDVGIRVEGEQVTLTGKVESQAERETAAARRRPCRAPAVGRAARTS